MSRQRIGAGWYAPCMCHLEVARIEGHREAMEAPMRNVLPLEMVIHQDPLNPVCAALSRQRAFKKMA